MPGPRADTTPRARARTRRPRLYRVVLLNDDFTPRDFVVAVLQAVFRMSEDEARGVMIAAHRHGACVVAVYPREVAETKAEDAIRAAREAGHPLRFSIEPER
jgi:ATP-dependent Clp protease adaptor protein ClpS